MSPKAIIEGAVCRIKAVLQLLCKLSIPSASDPRGVLRPSWVLEMMI
jgi:hypothetical protein